MKVVCEKCQAAFKVDAQRIKPGGSRARCGKCGHIFIVRQSEAIRPPSPEAEREAAPNPPKTPPGPSLQKPPVFRIVGQNNCPLYKVGDEFQLAGSSFTVPPKKAPCLILARDVVKILNGYKAYALPVPEAGGGKIFQCSGCKGMIRFVDKQDAASVEDEGEKPDDAYIENVTLALSRFSIFKALDENVIREFTSCLRFDEFAAEDLIIKKGDPGRHLYIIVSGQVEVLSDDEMRLSVMGKGEVFGEMSILSGDAVGATIRAVEPTTVLYITSQNFKTVLNNSPSLQMYFTRLLAERMAEINKARSEEFGFGLSGKISEMTPAELFQIFNMNQKTGILMLKVCDVDARLFFRDGELVRVQYGEREGKEAFFELLKLRRGRFSFKPGLSPADMRAEALGDFMMLLMEGTRRIDEDDKRFLRTVVPSLI